MTPRLLAMFPQVTGHGGVQRLSRHTAAALQAAASERGMELEVLSLLEVDTRGTVDVGKVAVPYRGFSRRHGELLRAYRGLAGGAVACWVGHPFMAPLASLGLLPRPAIPYLVHSHGIEVWQRLPWLRRSAIRRARIASNSSVYTGTRVVALQGVAADRLEVLHPALDPDFSIAEQSGPREPIIDRKSVV